MTARTLVVSPHLDDAVFSLGRLLARVGPAALVVTVHGGGSPERLHEDTAAMAVLGCAPRPWPHPPDTTPIGLDSRLNRLSAHRFDQVLVPLGIYHPDHLAVAEACRSTDWGTASVGVYEDLPYRVWWPDQAYQRRRVWGLPVCGEPETQAGPLDLKLKAAECYRSQLSDDIREVLGVPERVWWT